MSCIEYEFERQDRTKRYEIIDTEAAYSVIQQVEVSGNRTEPSSRAPCSLRSLKIRKINPDLFQQPSHSCGAVLLTNALVVVVQIE
jgi:hypothetical protein